MEDGKETNKSSKIKIFIGSSNKNNEYAIALAAAFDRLEVYEVTAWKDAFPAGSWTLENLIARSDEVDFGIFLFAKDDFVVSPATSAQRRGRHQKGGSDGYFIPRPNVIFELGLFMGKLGRLGVYFAVPTSREHFEVPSDLAGITYPTYDADTDNIRQEMEKVARRVHEGMVNGSTPPKTATLKTLLSEVQSTLEAVSIATQTRFVGQYPDFFGPNICPLLESAKEVWIACDFLDYGFFSQHAVCQEYLERLRTIPSVNIILPSEPRRRDLLRRQIPPTYWKEHYRKGSIFYANVRRLEQYLDGVQIKNPQQFYEAVAIHQRQHIKTLRRLRNDADNGPKIEEIDVDLPLYLWINDSGDAVFSIPVEDAPLGSSVEHAFSTKDRGLVNALRATWLRYYRHASQKPRFAKKRTKKP